MATKLGIIYVNAFQDSKEGMDKESRKKNIFLVA